MHKKRHLKSPTTGRGRKAFLREPGTQRQVGAKTLWFLSRAGDAAGGRARFEVGGAALQSEEEEEEGEGRMKKREALSENDTLRRRRRRGLGGVGPSHLLQPPVSRFPVWRAAVREREGGGGGGHRMRQAWSRTCGDSCSACREALCVGVQLRLYGFNSSESFWFTRV